MNGIVDIKTGYSCNNNCLFCAVKHHPPGDKTTDQYITEMQTARARNNRIIITGGEVTIRDDFTELICAAKKLNFIIHVQTNGRRFSDNQFCKNVSNLGISGYLVSIHGHNASLHNRLVGMYGAFEETEIGIRNLLNYHQNIQTNTVLTTLNLPYLSDITRYLINLGVRNIMYSYPDICGAMLDNITILPRYLEISKQMTDTINQCNNARVQILFDNIPLCQVEPQYRRYINRHSSIDLVMLDGSNIDFNSNDRNISLDKCHTCFLMSQCCRPQQKYLDIFGEPNHVSY